MPLVPGSEPTPTAAPRAWRSGRARRLAAGLAAVAAVGIGVGCDAVEHPDALSSTVVTALATATDGALDLRRSVPPPAAEVVALADAAHLTSAGRELLYRHRPEVLDATAFAGRCDADGARGLVAPGRAVGCYWQGTGRIVVFRPSDERLTGFVVETLAHELLHAQWEELSDDEQGALVPLLEAAVGRVPAGDALHTQLAGSVGDEPDSRPTELFAYLGTQVWLGGLDPALEDAWSAVVADRAALVGVHDSWQAVLRELGSEVRAAGESLVARETATATARAQLTADAAARDAYRTAVAEQESRLAAMSADERSRLLLSWTWWDGTQLAQAPAAETIAAAHVLLDRDDAALAAREVTVAADEARDAAERARVQALADDLERLHAALDPTTAG